MEKRFIPGTIHAVCPNEGGTMTWDLPETTKEEIANLTHSGQVEFQAELEKSLQQITAVLGSILLEAPDTLSALSKLQALLARFAKRELELVIKAETSTAKKPSGT